MAVARSVSDGRLRQAAGGDGRKLAVEDKVLAALGEALGDHLRVERVGEHLGPILEGSIGSDGGRAPVVVALGDDLEGELGLGGVHGEDGQIVEDEQIGPHVTAHRLLERAVDLRAGEVIEHLRGAGKDHPPYRLASAVGECPGPFPDAR